MKNWIIVLSLFFGISMAIHAQNELAPFLGVTTKGDVVQIKTQIFDALQNAGFEKIGDYEVAGNKDLQVICFTRDDLKKAAASFEERGALASVLKIGIRKVDSDYEVSLAHPNYMFLAYFGDEFDKQKDALNVIDNDAKNILVNTFGPISDFGGYVEKEELKKYHYKVMMPYFVDPIELEEYESFNEGLEFIRNKIKAHSKDLKLVYEVVSMENQTAVFGFGLSNPETGEAHFLPIIGERNIAALPYDLILQGKEVSMLHGKYRFALYWPELTMGTFMKIMSTPGDVEDMMELITEKE